MFMVSIGTINNELYDLYGDGDFGILKNQMQVLVFVKEFGVLRL